MSELGRYLRQKNWDETPTSAAIEDNIFKLVHNLDMGRGLSKRLKQTQIGGTIITRTPKKCLDPCNGDATRRHDTVCIISVNKISY